MQVSLLNSFEVGTVLISQTLIPHCPFYSTRSPIAPQNPKLHLSCLENRTQVISFFFFFLRFLGNRTESNWTPYFFALSLHLRETHQKLHEPIYG
jgi:hypothetical protein